MSSPIIFYNLICSLIACLQTFDSYAYLGVGENNATNFISIRIYVTAFAGDVHNYGLACAMAVDPLFGHRGADGRHVQDEQMGFLRRQIDG